ncbi:MAG TPA: CotH kinase family protein [Planctomycetota bacterium]|nr:CotH kinase family protein [Planctomycetota bacterium]
MAARGARFRLGALHGAAALLALVPWGTCGAECKHIDDPFQIIDLYLEMDPADWDLLRDIQVPADERPAMFHACDEAPIPVMVRRKTITVTPDEPKPVKISLKVDFDNGADDGEWHGRRELSLEAGRGVGRGTLLREGIAWQLMARSGLIVGGSSWVRVHVNGASIGVMTRVEQVDKSYLRRHVGEDEGFLYKIDYNIEGLRKRITRIGEPDPYAADLCFPPFDETCPIPADWQTSLPKHLDVPQLFTIAAVNACISNFDGPFFVNNNYYWYNSERPRLHFPWDLDLVLLTGLEREDPHAPKLPSDWMPVLLGDPALREFYDETLVQLLDDALSPDAMGRFLDELAPVIGPAMDADPFNDFDGDFANELSKLRRFFEARYDYLRTQLPASSPFPVVINEVLAANASINTDEGGSHADWVELYNRGDHDASLLGLYLSDDPAEPRKWRVPDVTLPAGGHLLVWCDLDVEEGPLHTGFQLNADGEAVGLYEIADRAPQGSYRRVDFVRFGPQAPDVSLGRLPDGSPGFRRLPCPTPAGPNREACDAPGPAFLRGDVNGDGALNITDAVRTLLGLFGGLPLPCERSADANDDGSINLTDVLAVLQYLFRFGEPLPPPFPACGRGSGALGCSHAPSCR